MSQVTSTEARSSWKDVVARKQAECKSKLPSAWTLPETIFSGLQYPLDQNPNKLLGMDIPRRSGIMTDRELHITEDFTVAELLKKLATGELTSLEVTIAFSKRAVIAQQLVSSAGCLSG